MASQKDDHVDEFTSNYERENDDYVQASLEYIQQIQDSYTPGI